LKTTTENNDQSRERRKQLVMDSLLTSPTKQSVEGTSLMGYQQPGSREMA
jgi:hypothetical protein